MRRSLHATEVDAVPQHRQLRPVQLGARTCVWQMDLESPAVQALVPEHHAAFLKRQDLRTVSPARDEDVQMAAYGSSPAAVTREEGPSKPLRMSVAPVPVKSRSRVVTDRPSIGYRSMSRSNSAT
jgi:hypothetical protein